MSVDAESNAQHDAGDTPKRAGDCFLPLTETACARILAEYSPMVTAVSQRILRDEGLAQDTTQEVFFLFVRKLPSLAPGTILGGWLYLTACHIARARMRTETRRKHRESGANAVEEPMKAPEGSLWDELEPLLDEAMLTLPDRQRELVLFRYFQNNSQRAAAILAGCSETVASRELAAAIERLRKFFRRHGVEISGTALATLLATRATHALIGSMTSAGALATASALAGTTAATASLLFTLMKTTTGFKLAVVIAALLLFGGGSAYYVTRNSENPAALTKNKAEKPVVTHPSNPRPESKIRTAVPPATTTAGIQSGQTTNRDDALKAARERERKFWERVDQLALMGDAEKAREILLKEYGINISVDQFRSLQEKGQKLFRFGIIDLWAAQQPREALAFAASALSEPNGDWAFQKLFLDGARSALPNLDHATLAGFLLDEAPGKSRLLDLFDASADPRALAGRILSTTDPEERAARLRLLALGWSEAESAVAWARENLSGAEKETFYSQAAYNLADQNPQAALQALHELEGTASYATSFDRMMRGLVQIGGLGSQAAELIANADITPKERTDLISELARRWVRNDPEATISWANGLTAPEEFRAAIPLLVSQLDNQRVSSTVQNFLKNNDPVMELALIEAAAPPGLLFDAEKSRLILDPLISRDPGLKLTSENADAQSRNAMLWSSVTQTGKRLAEDGSPSAAMQWLGALPFASQGEYARAASEVLEVWKLKSESDASAWLQKSPLPPLK